MRLIRCTQGHFFDADSYQVCPHCGSPAAGKTPSQPVQPHGNTQEKKSGRSFLSFGKKKEDKRAPVREVYGGPGQGVPGQGYPNPGRPGPGYPSQGMPGQGYPNAGVPGQGYPMQGSAVQNRPNQGVPPQGYVNPKPGQTGNPPVWPSKQAPVTGRTDNGNASQVFVQPSSSQPGDIVQKTYDIYGVQSTPNPSKPAVPAPQGQAANAAVSYTPQAEARPEPVQAPAPVQTPASPVQAEPEAPAPEPAEEVVREENVPSLQQMVQQASANEEGKTMSYFSTVASAKAAQAGAENAQAAPAGSGPADPVVGWLVCVKGANFGRSYSICAGRNSIGRGQDNRICIAGDMSISRQKQAFLIYEPRHKDFFLAPGEASGLTYLNGEYLSEMKKLSASDKIDMGEATFLFVPLCGEDFSWEDYLE